MKEAMSEVRVRWLRACRQLVDLTDLSRGQIRYPMISPQISSNENIQYYRLIHTHLTRPPRLEPLLARIFPMHSRRITAVH